MGLAERLSQSFWGAVLEEARDVDRRLQAEDSRPNFSYELTKALNEVNEAISKVRFDISAVCKSYRLTARALTSCAERQEKTNYAIARMNSELRRAASDFEDASLSTAAVEFSAYCTLKALSGADIGMPPHDCLEK